MLNTLKKTYEKKSLLAQTPRQKSLFDELDFTYESKPILRSALFYVGDKYKLMKELRVFFPKNIKRYFEAFVGGGSSFLNTKAKSYFLNDIDSHIISLHRFLQSKAGAKEEFFNKLFALIKEYNLTCSFLHFLPPQGLKEQYKKTYFARFNKEAYINLRADFNADKKDFFRLYLLLIYGFNHFLRFNVRGEFNLPVGNVDFNNNVFKALNEHLDFIKDKNISFFNEDYKSFLSRFSFERGDFIYFDPPYLISGSEYNKLWSEKHEQELYVLLKELDLQGVKWGLSNLLSHKGRKNELLLEFAKNYQSHKIKSNYISFNDNSIKKDSCELYITNFKET